jgi:hypothetical protein
MSDDKIKHLEFIQDIITRMNTNSFQMKGWMVVVVSALLAIYADKQNGLYVLFALLPTFIFWGLDSYYLQQERKFRGLYNDVAGISENLQEIKPFATEFQKPPKRSNPLRCRLTFTKVESIRTGMFSCL